MNSYIIDLVLSPVVQFRMYNKGGSVEIYIIYQCSQEREYIKYEYSNLKKKIPRLSWWAIEPGSLAWQVEC